MAQRSISTKELRADCALLERSVLAGGAVQATIAANRPGGAANDDRSARGWLAYYRWLHRTHARQHGSDEAPRFGHRLADAEVVDALRSAPVPVLLVGRPADAPPMYVYAKSFDALVQVHALDAQLAWMVDQHDRLLRIGGVQALELMPQLMASISYTYKLLAWIVTSKGPGMPYALDDDRPVPPAEIEALEPWDLIRVVEAHHTHLLRLQALSVLIDPRPATKEGKGTRPSWSAFFGAMELETGHSAETLMTTRALTAVLATVRLANASRESVVPEKG